MLNINFVQKSENLSSFGNESDIQAMILLDNIPEDIFSNENSMSTALGMYGDTAVFQDINNNSQLIIDEIYDRAYNEEALLKVLRFISIYPDEYNDLIKFIHAILQKININSEIEFILNLSKFSESEIESHIKNNVEQESNSEKSTDDNNEPQKGFKDYNAIIHED